jgi:MYXO-CTERM domain-containing protein
MRTRHALGTGLVFTLLASAAPALADVTVPSAAGDTASQYDTGSAQVLRVTPGNFGRMDGDVKFRYPGVEQTELVYSKNHIVMITMEAVNERGKAPVQCSCTSYEMTDAGPVLRTPLKRLTDYAAGQQRTCNHPKAAADENGNIAWGYGSDYNNNRPNTYVGIIDEKCQTLASPQMVSIPRDANDGALSIKYAGGGRWVGAYYSDGNDGPGFPGQGGDYVVTFGLQIEQTGLLPTLKRTWIEPTMMNGAIMRPSVEIVGDRALVAAAHDGNRPAVNVDVAMIDVGTGKTVWKNYIHKGDPGKGIYFNSPVLQRLNPTDPNDKRVALVDWQSDGGGRGTNNKGRSQARLTLLDVNGDSVNIVSERADLAGYQNHASLCTGAYGEKGERAAVVYTGPPKDVGRNMMAVLPYDGNTKQFTFDEKFDLWPASYYGGSSKLANLYGANPMRQGRDHLWCIGDVPNAGYGKANGYMKNVKSFFAAAVHGRVPGDLKNSLFLSLIPGQVDKKLMPGNAVPLGEEPIVEQTATTPEASSSESSGGCGCATPGQKPVSTAAGLAAIGALGLALSRRRRRH